jgi:hypothetical protein
MARQSHAMEDMHTDVKPASRGRAKSKSRPAGPSQKRR